LLDKLGVVCYYYFVNPERGFLLGQGLAISSHGVVGAKPSYMNKIKNRLHSFILLPLLLTNVNTPDVFDKPFIPDTVVEQLGLNFHNSIQKDDTSLVDTRAAKIDAYFAQWDLPMAGHGAGMVAAADEYGLDWRLLPALAKLETTGGKNLCQNPKGKNNPFGYGSCQIGFATFEDSFYAVAKTLSGNGKNTSHLYKDKSIEEILEVYNPPATPGITPDYHGKALKIMSDIEKMEVGATLAKV